MAKSRPRYHKTNFLITLRKPPRLGNEQHKFGIKKTKKQKRGKKKSGFK